MIAPHGRPQDVIAVVTLGIWFIGFPSLMLLGLIAPFFVTKTNPVAKGCIALHRACLFLLGGSFSRCRRLLGVRSYMRLEMAMVET